VSNIEAVSKFGLGQLWEGVLDLIIQGQPAVGRVCIDDQVRVLVHGQEMFRLVNHSQLVQVVAMSHRVSPIPLALDEGLEAVHQPRLHLVQKRHSYLL